MTEGEKKENDSGPLTGSQASQITDKNSLKLIIVLLLQLMMMMLMKVMIMMTSRVMVAEKD